MRIIGIDPGMAICGYSIIDVNTSGADDKYTLVTSGSIQTEKNRAISLRLAEIYEDLSYLIKTYKPDVAAVEQIFYFKNAKTIIPVAQARGVIVMLFGMYKIPVYEYTPMVVKQTITGYGKADKADISSMIQIILNSDRIPKLDDASDAIAIAICHARHCECQVN